MSLKNINTVNIGKGTPTVGKFYFLDYFKILLLSADKFTDKNKVFGEFRDLKGHYRLGESKYRYRKQSGNKAKLSAGQLSRFRYSFDQVISESEEYHLVKHGKDELLLTEKGKYLITVQSNKGDIEFYFELLKLMESRHEAFKHIISSIYKANTNDLNLFVFPFYSPLQLLFDRPKPKTVNDLLRYSNALIQKLESDLRKYLKHSINLMGVDKELISRLQEDELIPNKPHFEFDPKKYSAIIKRFKDYWANYFLKELYHCDYSMSTFDLWTYRGKQIGIINVTEFYPYFHGKLVYPTSIIRTKSFSEDYKPLFEYSNGDYLYLHNPKIEKIQDRFVDQLAKAYFTLRKSTRGYFVSLLSVREIVCYNLKISESIFASYLSTVYRLNLSGKLKIRISLEVDKLPDETKVMYSTREPIPVDGKFRNIIAIDLSK